MEVSVHWISFCILILIFVIHQPHSSVASAVGLKPKPPVSPEEQVALEDLYNSTNGPYWSLNKKWLSDDDSACDWFGVGCTCDEQSKSFCFLKLSFSRIVLYLHN